MTQMSVEIDKRGAPWAPLLTIHSTARVESLARRAKLFHTNCSNLGTKQLFYSLEPCATV